MTVIQLGGGGGAGVAVGGAGGVIDLPHICAEIEQFGNSLLLSHLARSTGL